MINTKKDFKLELIPFLVNYVLLIGYCFLFGNKSDLFVITPVFVVFFMTGELFVSFFFEHLKIDATLAYGLNIFLGGILLFPLLCLFSFLPIWYFRIFLFVVGIIFFRKYHLNFSFKTQKISYYFLLGIVFLTTLYGTNVYEALVQHPILQGELTDNYFYTSIVASLKEGTILHAKYEIESPIKYHLGGFLWPSTLCALSGIKSHTALWQIFIPFLRFLCTYFISFLIVDLSSKFVKVDRRNLYMILVVVIFLGITTINPKYILNFTLDKLIWVGTPFTLSDKPALSSSLLICLLIVYLISKVTFCKNKERIGLIIIYSSLVLFKVTSFFVFSVLFFVWAVVVYMKEKRLDYLKIISLSVLPTLVLYYLFYVDQYSNVKFVFSPFYLEEYFNGLANLSWNTTIDIFKGLLVFLITFVIWIGIKFIGIIWLYRENRSYLLYPFLLCFFIILFLASTFRINIVNSEGIILHDISYDLMQFFKFYLLGVTLISVAGFLRIFMNYRSFSYWKRLLFFATILIYFILSYSSLISMCFPVKQMQEDKWAKDVNYELQQAKPNLCITQPSNDYSGQLVSAYDNVSFYISIDNRIGGVTTTFRGDLSRKKLKQFLSSEDFSQQKEILLFFQQKKVDCIIANPNTEDALNKMVQNKLLSKKSNYKWLYFIATSK
jgi:hypothetical protein